MKKLTDQQLKNYEFLSGVIISGEIPYDDPDGYPYLMIDNTEWTKSDLEERVEEALSKGQLENPEYLDDVVVFIKKHIDNISHYRRLKRGYFGSLFFYHPYSKIS